MMGLKLIHVSKRVPGHKAKWNFHKTIFLFLFHYSLCIWNRIMTLRQHNSMADILNTLWLRQNGRHFADNIFKCIFLNENIWLWIEISLKFVPKGPINNIPALVQIMAWRRQGDKPLFEPMMVSLLMHICVTRLQWVNSNSTGAGLFRAN